MKAVLDTNVLISAFLSDGICSRFLRRARNREFDFILCRQVAGEFGRILKDKFKFDNSDISFFNDIISEASHETFQPENHLPCVCRDRDDDYILACSSETEADFLVTGDDDLLSLIFYQKVKIVTFREFEMLFED